MCLALVLEHFESERGIVWINEVVLDVLTVQISEAMFQAGGALIKNTQFLVTQRHIVHC